MDCFRDIIDVKHIKGSMKGIMMGSLSRTIDDEPEYFGDDDHACACA